jgi:hypothetical protein
MQHTQVTPNALHLVMAIETQYRQSLFPILNATRVTPSDPPGLRRLRFPSFIQFSKSKSATRIPEPVRLDRLRRQRGPYRLVPVENPRCRETIWAAKHRVPRPAAELIPTR